MKNLNKIRERPPERILLDEELIKREQLDSVIEENSGKDTVLIEAILDNDYVAEWDLARSLVENYQLPFLYSTEYQINKEVRKLFPPVFLHTHKIHPIDLFGNTLILVTSGNINEEIIEEIEETTRKEVSLYISLHSEVKKTLENSFPLDEITSELNSRMDELFGG